MAVHLQQLASSNPGAAHAARHLWSKTPEEADERLTLTKLVERLPADTTSDLVRLLNALLQANRRRTLLPPA